MTINTKKKKIDALKVDIVALAAHRVRINLLMASHILTKKWIRLAETVVPLKLQGNAVGELSDDPVAPSTV